MNATGRRPHPESPVAEYDILDKRIEGSSAHLE
jgi:hypothetical protein